MTTRYKETYSWRGDDTYTLVEIAMREFRRSDGGIAERADDSAEALAKAFGRLLEILVSGGRLGAAEAIAVIGAGGYEPVE